MAMEESKAKIGINPEGFTLFFLGIYLINGLINENFDKIKIRYFRKGGV